MSIQIYSPTLAVGPVWTDPMNILASDNAYAILAFGLIQYLEGMNYGIVGAGVINQVEVGGQHKILQSLRHGYGKAPHFDAVYPIIEDILAQTEKNLARFLDYQLRHICDYLGLRPQWHISSALNKDNGLRGQDKVLSICEELGATHYINVPGGKALYDQPSFAERDLQLSFIQPRAVSYRQFGKEFVPNLSIIDVMMFNDREQCAELLEEYDLV